MKITYPEFLKAGDSIGITCPAGFMPYENAENCISILQSWGYEVIVGKTLGSDSRNYFSAPDKERTDELQAMLDNKDLKAILFGRGGYGMTRIIDKLKFKKFKKNPKWLIGFSDITVMHCHLLSRYGISSIHAPMAAAFKNGENFYTDSLKNLISGTKQHYQCDTHPFNTKGTAKGILVGGNLALLTHIIGTKSDINTKNCILFLEDIGEYIYNADRMLYQLKRSGKFKKIKGLVIGGFSDMKDTERPFGKTILEAVYEITDGLDIPTCFNFPVSHDKENVALIVGGEYKLSVSEKFSILEEI